GIRSSPLGAGVMLALVAPIGVSAVQRSDSAASPIAASKLTSILADLSGAVPQDQGGVPGAAPQSVAARPLSVDTLPKSVQDAVQGQLLRINQAREVQVYILLTEVSDDTVGELTDAGATVEIRDGSRRRVQARVPVSRLQLVAHLPVVDAVRLPTYA